MARLMVLCGAVGVFLSFTAVAGAAVISPSDLLVYYNFDNNGNPTIAPDLSGNGPMATLEGGAAYSAGGGGVSGSAGDRSLDLGTFNNGASARLPLGAHFDPAVTSNTFAVSFWQNSTSNATSTSSYWIVSPTASGGRRGIQSHVSWSDGTIYFDHAGCCGPPERLTTGITGPINTWNHYVFQKDASGNKQLWENGVLRVSGAGAANVLPFDGQAMIGAEFRDPGTNGANSFDGRIDEFAVWSTTLDAAQIAQLASGAPATALTIPEPATLALLALGGLAALPLVRRRRSA